MWGKGYVNASTHAKWTTGTWVAVLILGTLLNCIAANYSDTKDALPNFEVQLLMFSLVGVAAACGWFESARSVPKEKGNFWLLAGVYFLFVAAAATRAGLVWANQNVDFRVGSTLVAAAFSFLVVGCSWRESSLGAVLTVPLALWFGYLSVFSSLAHATSSSKLVC